MEVGQGPGRTEVAGALPKHTVSAVESCNLCCFIRRKTTDMKQLELFLTRCVSTHAPAPHPVVSSPLYHLIVWPPGCRQPSSEQRVWARPIGEPCLHDSAKVARRACIALSSSGLSYPPTPVFKTKTSQEPWVHTGKGGCLLWWSLSLREAENDGVCEYVLQIQNIVW